MSQQADPRKPYDYLCVDEFMRGFLEARALSTAFQNGLIDHLLQSPISTMEEMSSKLDIDREGLRLLLDLLRVNQVVEGSPSGVRLSQKFLFALGYRDLLEAKLEFTHIVAHDILDHFPALVATPKRFMEKAKLFQLFDYQRCLVRTTENENLTRRWMHFTTALTRYEAQVCLQLHDFSQYARMLDIGGNSGEFVLHVCRRHEGIRAVVLDLPVVCDIGEEHVGVHPESDRILFLRGDAFRDTFPEGLDLISFKSMLHDWPVDDMRQVLGRAVQALEPGGTILIFERGPVRIDTDSVPYSSLPMLLFYRFFRSPSVYQTVLEAAGLQDITIQEIDLDTPFFLITGRKNSV